MGGSRGRHSPILGLKISIGFVEVPGEISFKDHFLLLTYLKAPIRFLLGPYYDLTRYELANILLSSLITLRLSDYPSRWSSHLSWLDKGIIY